MMDHPYGWLSLLPPITAIALAICTRRIIASLLLGILTGSLLMAIFHHQAYAPDVPAWRAIPVEAVASIFRDHLWSTLVQEEKLAVFSFTLLMGALVGIIRRNGGMLGLVNAVARWANNVRRGQFAAWLLGLLVFFDDYANTMLLGGTLRPLFDRLKISREKLAYLVDSTAAPVSGLALISTWVAGEIGYVRDGLEQLPNVDWDPLGIFLNSIPYRFYVLWALLLVPMVAWLGRDLGPMVAAERRARSKDSTDTGPKDEGHAAHWVYAVGPIMVTVGAIIWLMHHSGVAALNDSQMPISEQSLMQVFGNADAFMSLVWGSLIGAAFAAVLTWSRKLLSGAEIQQAASEGALHMLPALAILWLASAMSTMTGNSEPARDLPVSDAVAASDFPHQAQRLYAGEYLGATLENRVPAWILPTLVFLLAGGVAFATGTSWGTMGVLMPLTIGAAYRILAAEGSSPAPDHPLLLASVGSVLAGAIFGDHCSPISDTTVMSSQACQCSHIEHVRTQMPYALLAGGTSVLVGTLPIGLGVSPWLLLPCGVLVMGLTLRLCGTTTA